MANRQRLKAVNTVLLSALMVFGLVLLTGRASSGEEAGEYPDDSALTEQINRAIGEDPDAHLFKVQVTTIRGSVLLQGSVNNGETEKRIITVTSQIRGVKSVKNLMTVGNRKKPDKEE